MLLQSGAVGVLPSPDTSESSNFAQAGRQAAIVGMHSRRRLLVQAGAVCQKRSKDRSQRLVEIQFRRLGAGEDENPDSKAVSSVSRHLAPTCPLRMAGSAGVTPVLCSHRSAQRGRSDPRDSHTDH